MGYIYRIYNDVNSHIYIGQTSMRISDRWSGHLCSAKKEELPNYNDTIHKAMRKYGIDKFHIEVIEKCDNDFLNEREIYWIKHFNSFENGYNETLGGGGCQKYNHKEIVENYKKTHNLSETARQIGCCIGTVIKVLDVAEDCGEDLQRYRNFEWAKEPIYQIDKDTFEIIAEYPSITEAAKAMNGKVGHISAVLNGHKNDKTAYGYLWQKVKDYDGTIKHIDEREKQVICIETGMTFKTMKSACQWVKDSNKKSTKIENMHSNIRRSIKRGIKAYGYHWEEI